MAISIEPDTLDPHGQTTTTVGNVVDHAVETLVSLGEDGKAHPSLAETWEISDDGLILTFNLREGVAFHDGEPFDGEAVKFNFERLLDPDIRAPLRQPYEIIEEVEVVDDHTVALHLSRPSPSLVGALTWTTAGLISPASIEEHGNSYENIVHPVGTGPYVFQEFVEARRVVYNKFDGYWGEQPHFDTQIFRIVPEAATRVSELLTGQSDAIMLPPVSDLPQLQNDDNVEVVLGRTTRMVFGGINTKDEVLSDVRVRQALNYAVDKQAIIDSVLQGAGDVATAPISQEMFGYCEVGAYEYDPDRARELLEEAGATDLKVEYLTPTGRYLQDFEFTQAIAGFWDEVGVTAQVRTLDWPAYLEAIGADAEEQGRRIHTFGWAGVFPDANLMLPPLFQSEFQPPAGFNASFYKNPRVDELIKQAEVELDEERRADLYCEANQIIMEEDAPWIFLWTQRFPIGHTAEVENIGVLPNEKFAVVYVRPSGQ